MVKTPKKLKSNSKHLNQPTRIRLRKRFKKKKKNKSNIIYGNFISSVPVNKNKKINVSNSKNISNIIIQITLVFDLLSDIFSTDLVKSKKSLNDLNLMLNNANKELYADFGKSLSPDDFYKCFLSYLKKKINENKIQAICSSSLQTIYYSLFQNLKTKDINSYLFSQNISTYIRQDIILSAFDYSKKTVKDFVFVIFNMDDNCYSLINNTNLIIDESVDEFKTHYLFSNCVLQSIKLTLSNYISNIDENTIKDAISQLLTKIKFYYANIDENFAAISFLGYNVIIRKYFKDFNDKSIKVALRNVIAHEIIHLLIIELTDKNFFVYSIERNSKNITESGDYFEKLFFGIEVKYFSSSLISYLQNFDNFEKSLTSFNNDIINIYNQTCKKEENNILVLSDSSCIKRGIVRSKYSEKYNIKDNGFGHCSRHLNRINYFTDNF